VHKNDACGGPELDRADRPFPAISTTLDKATENRGDKDGRNISPRGTNVCRDTILEIDMRPNLMQASAHRERAYVRRTDNTRLYLLGDFPIF
jgi:hypothetical protein